MTSAIGTLFAERTCFDILSDAFGDGPTIEISTCTTRDFEDTDRNWSVIAGILEFLQMNLRLGGYRNCVVGSIWLYFVRLYRHSAH